MRPFSTLIIVAIAWWATACRAGPAGEPDTDMGDREPAAAGSEGDRNSPVEGRAAATGKRDNRLSVRFEPTARDGEAVVDLGDSLRVVLVNASDQPVRVWNPATRNGYDQISFTFTNARSGQVGVARRRVIQNDEYWDAVASEIDPGDQVVWIPAHGSIEIPVSLGDLAWRERAWIDVPDPNTDERYSVSAQFDATAEADDTGRTLWTGRITSPATEVCVTAAAFSTPQAYLANGFPSAALRRLAAEPGLVNARDELHDAPLHVAARHGQVGAVQWLLDHGADVNAKGRDRATPLHVAKDLAVVRALLAKTPDLEIRCAVRGQTPLERAASQLVYAQREGDRRNWRRIVGALVDAGAEHNLLTAIHVNDLERVQAILARSPDLADNFEGNSPLRSAAALGRLEICRYLIREHRVDVDDRDRGGGLPILREALAFPAVVRLLIENGADLGSRITVSGGRTGIQLIGDNATVLHYAASEGVPETIGILLEHGADLFAASDGAGGSPPGRTPLEIASLLGKADLTQAMVAHRQFAAAAPEIRQAVLDATLRLSVVPTGFDDKNQRPRLVRVLLDHRPGPMSPDQLADLLSAATQAIRPRDPTWNGNLRKIADVLIDRGAPVDLCSSVALGDIERVRQALPDAPPTDENFGGIPPLHLAVMRDDPEIAAALLKAGLDVEARHTGIDAEFHGATVLHAAAWGGREKIARLLLESGAQVNALASDRSTPLHLAAERGHVSLVELLLANGADVAGRDSDDRTPLDGCRASTSINAPQVAALLRAAGARE